jgi:methylenetetrahydrofolate dehydrogenase (NADP+)/methenyltetrahydrofolate cyclohydrolase
MTAHIIDGKQVAAQLRQEIAHRVATLPFQPGLAVVLVGDDPASQVYVRNKDRAAREAGLSARTIRLPAETTQAELLAHIHQLNQDDSVDGILVQFPVPKHIDQRAVILAIDPAKDVDGLHPQNIGRLADGSAQLVSCTPKGVIKLLAAANVPLSGKRALVLGRSLLVGKPVASLLINEDATVTVAHSKTLNLPAECRRAEIIVAAIGRPEFVRGDWISPGTIIIDVGINRLPDGSLAGDVAFEEAKHQAAAITPVPGGVGPMTIACLLENTLIAGLGRRGRK